MLLQGVPNDTEAYQWNDSLGRYVVWTVYSGYWIPVISGDPGFDLQSGAALWVKLPPKPVGWVDWWDDFEIDTDQSMLVSARGIVPAETDPLAGTGPGENMLANTTYRTKTFNNVGESDPDKITVPFGTSVYRWNAETQSFIASHFTIIGWIGGAPSIGPMEGYILELP